MGRAHVLSDVHYAHHLLANRIRSQTYWCQKQHFQMKEGLHGFLCLGVQSDLWSRTMMAEKDSFLQRNLTLTRIPVHALDIQTTARFLSAMALVRRPLECLVQIFQSLSHELASSWDNCMWWSSRCSFFHKYIEAPSSAPQDQLYAVNILFSQWKMRDQIELGFAFGGDFDHFCFDKHVVSVERWSSNKMKA